MPTTYYSQGQLQNNNNNFLPDRAPTVVGIGLGIICPCVVLDWELAVLGVGWETRGDEDRKVGWVHQLVRGGGGWQQPRY